MTTTPNPGNPRIPIGLLARRSKTASFYGHTECGPNGVGIRAVIRRGPSFAHYALAYADIDEKTGKIGKPTYNSPEYSSIETITTMVTDTIDALERLTTRAFAREEDEDAL